MSDGQLRAATRHQAGNTNQLLVPGEDAATEGQALAWCEALLLGASDVTVVWHGRPCPSYGATTD